MFSPTHRDDDVAHPDSLLGRLIGLSKGASPEQENRVDVHRVNRRAVIGEHRAERPSHDFRPVDDRNRLTCGRSGMRKEGGGEGEQTSELSKKKKRWVCAHQRFAQQWQPKPCRLIGPQQAAGQYTKGGGVSLSGAGRQLSALSHNISTTRTVYHA